MKTLEIRQLLIFILLGMLINITGCSEYIHDRNASTIDVVPINYHLQVKVHASDLNKSIDKVEHYINSHQQQLVDNNIELSWYSKNAYRVAHTVKKDLVLKGFSSDSIHIIKGQQSKDKPYFDLELFAQKYETVSSICHYTQIEDYGRYSEGCVVEGNRWQMMNHPERALSSVNSTVSEE